MILRRHHHIADSRKPQSLLLLAAGLTAATFVAEFAGAYFSNSMALLSDAGHVFMDFTALLFSLFALRLAQRPASDRRTFGLHRLEVFAAFLNGVLVAGIAVWILIHSARRLAAPPAVRVDVMLTLAVLGLLVNLVVAWRLHAFAREDVNIRGAFLHVASDALASVGVVAAGLIIRFTGALVADPLVGLFVGAVILVNAGRLVVESVEILLEGVPRHLRLADVVAAMRAVPGVDGVEDTHIWCLCSHICSLSAHVTLRADRMADQDRVVAAINAVLRDRFRIAHSTIQVHSAGWKNDAGAAH